MIFRDGVLKPTQMGTQSMSMAVSELFWKMVRETVEQQADAFKGQALVIHVIKSHSILAYAYELLSVLWAWFMFSS